MSLPAHPILLVLRIFICPMFCLMCPMFRPLCVSFCGAIILSDGRRVPPRYADGRLRFFIISRKCVKINPLWVIWFVNTHKSTLNNFRGGEWHGEQQEADFQGSRYQGKSDSQRRSLQRQVQVCRRQCPGADQTGQEEVSPKPMGSDALPNTPAHPLRGNPVIRCIT